MSGETDIMGRARRRSQGGAGPKNLPSKDAPGVGQINTTPPKTLDTHGLAFWREALAVLEPMGFIDEADRIFLIHTAETFQLYKECQEQIKLDGKTYMDANGNTKAHPLMTTMLKSGKDCFSYLSSLGLTPSARAKFGGGTDEDDPFARLLQSSKEN